MGNLTTLVMEVSVAAAASYNSTIPVIQTYFSSIFLSDEIIFLVQHWNLPFFLAKIFLGLMKWPIADSLNNLQRRLNLVLHVAFQASEHNLEVNGPVICSTPQAMIFGTAWDNSHRHIRCAAIFKITEMYYAMSNWIHWSEIGFERDWWLKTLVPCIYNILMKCLVFLVSAGFQDLECAANLWKEHHSNIGTIVASGYHPIPWVQQDKEKWGQIALSRTYADTLNVVIAG